MSIREHLHFNQKIDCIEGFEDLRRQGRTNNNANHALVSMLRGLYKRWKQPVAYYLSHVSTNGEMLVNFLVEVLDACCNAGLEIFATVCGMGANNFKALEQKRHPFSGFMIKKLHQCLILLISLNAQVTFP